ncbi:MAG: DUF4302 domain-containing protein, partial [Bacteroidales bacterium]|nr:DUF4302 domain-containing protein [Bacteroidales bacterium]
ILTTPANGWLMEYYGNTDYGGYNMFVKFSDNDMVEVANEVYGAGTHGLGIHEPLSLTMVA